MNAKTILAVSFAAILGISLAVASFAPAAIAASGANKTTFSSQSLVLNTEGLADDTAVIASATLKTSTPKDLVVMFSEECSLFTEVRLKSGSSGSVSESQVRAAQSIWLEVDDTFVPIGAGDVDGKVTMCDRTYNISTNILDQIQKLCSAVGAIDGVTTCDESVFESFIDTKDAHGWNWVVLNLGPGEHTVKVYSEFIDEEGVIGDGNASVAVGKRSLIILPQNLSNDAAY